MTGIATLTTLLAQSAGAEPSLAGWYVGFAIGVAVVLVVVIIVAAILTLASRISDQARMAIDALDEAHTNTLPLWDVSAVNRSARAILEGAVRARKAVER